MSDDEEDPVYEDPLEDECKISIVNKKIGRTLWFVIATIVILAVIFLMTYTLLSLEEKSTTAIYTLGIFSSIAVIYILYASRQNKRIGMCEDAGY